MVTIRIKSAKVKNFINRLKRQGKSFELQATAYSKIIKVGDVQYIISADRHNNDLFLAKRKVEEDINRARLEFDPVSHSDIKYFDLGARLVEAERQGIVKSVLNIDITAAYPTTLRNLGFITQGTYEYLLKASKPVRLRSIGMIATRKAVFYYEGGKFARREIKKDQYLKSVFYLVCAYVGEVISHFAKSYPDNFLYYWTDGIYLNMDGLNRDEVIKHAEQVFQHYKYQYHAHDLKDLKVTRSEDKRLIFVNFMKDGKMKPFIIPARRADTKQNNGYINHINKTQNLPQWTTPSKLTP